jgi:endo-1,4-beta-xylanase
LAHDAGYAALVREQSNIVVAENAMKWGPMRPTIDTYNFVEADALVAFAEANTMKVRGHNLCWHRQLPGWFETEATTANARDLLTSHIQHVAGRYAGRMHSWDVVNEAILPTDGRADGLRESPWLKLVGDDYIELAFHTARAADPTALLTYNDYGIEGEDAASARKRAAVLILMRRLKARRVPLDAVGIQSHISAGHQYGTGLTGFMTAIRGMGLQIFLTEMDVNDREWPADDGIRDSVVADTYGSYLDLTLREPAVRVAITWGITDRSTWLNSEDARRDHLPERCLPFDDKDAPTKAFFAIRNSFDKRVTV